MKNVVYGIGLIVLAGCSGGGGGGGGSTQAASMMQTSKMSCSGATCLGTGGLSLLSNPGSISTMAVSMDSAIGIYNKFNQTLIPQFNGLISKIEEGLRNGGSESCSDVYLPFEDDVVVGGVTYEAKAVTSNEAIPNIFSRTSGMTWKISAKKAGTNYLTADASCGQETDSNPLIARILAQDSGNQLNAWFEKGSSKHIRILMVAKVSGIAYAGWFKTSDGDNYDLVLASEGTYYAAAGTKSTKSIKVTADDGNGSTITDTCFNSETGASASNCTGTVPTPPTISSDLVGTTITDWTTVGNSITLQAPTY